LQIHITSTKSFEPVATAFEIFDAIIETSPEGSLIFNQPPYEYEEKLMPFDILSGDSLMRKALIERKGIRQEKDRWRYETELFLKDFKQISAYSE